jgi:hypothetical protein
MLLEESRRRSQSAVPPSGDPGRPSGNKRGRHATEMEVKLELDARARAAGMRAEDIFALA